MFSFRRTRTRAATLTAIFIAPAAGEPMRGVDAAEAQAGAGLRGDRYGESAGFWKATDACQVTLITTDDLKRAKRGQPADVAQRLDHGHHRRNLVVDGVTAKHLEGKRFRIGTAVFVYDKPRPPCGYLDQIEGAGLCRALGRDSGICIRVVGSGRVRIGDRLEIVP